MISKELLSEVLGSNIYMKQDGYEGYMEHSNIYELAHKCKEWANKFSHKEEVVDKQVKLLSYTDRFGGHCRIKLFPAQPDETDVSFHADTEPEAIFKACVWILKQKQG